MVFNYREQRDEIKLALDSFVAGQIEPDLKPNISELVTFKYRKVYAKVGTIKYQEIRDHVVLEIKFEKLTTKIPGIWCKYKNGTSRVRMLSSFKHLTKEETEEHEKKIRGE